MVAICCPMLSQYFMWKVAERYMKMILMGSNDGMYLVLLIVFHDWCCRYFLLWNKAKLEDRSDFSAVTSPNRTLPNALLSIS